MGMSWPLFGNAKVHEAARDERLKVQGAKDDGEKYQEEPY